jgi:hypothetical protein
VAGVFQRLETAYARFRKLGYRSDLTFSRHEVYLKLNFIVLFEDNGTDLAVQMEMNDATNY